MSAWQRQLTVPQFTVVSGLLVIALGTLLLATPLCSGPSVDLWEALFTATSAITVTGLSIIDVGTELTFFGQLVLAALIITGGLGLMAISTFLQGFVQGRTGLRQRIDQGRTLDQFGVGGVGSTFRAIVISGGVLMLIGTVLLYAFGFTDISNPGERLWAAMFHSISAFNNAGFSLWAGSLEAYQSNAVVCAVVAALVIAGGIGWRVLSDLWIHRRNPLEWRRLSLQSRVVLRSSVLLIVAGTLGLLFTERLAPAGVVGGLPLLQKVGVSLFQVISARTAGFVSVPLSLDTISHAGLFLLILLMFIGASPGGTGGGIKTTTFAVLLCTTRSTLEDRTEVVINRRRIPGKQVLRAVGITLASAGVVVLMTMLLGLGDTEAGVLGDEDFTFLEKLFTCVSAFASVGFDLGVTARLDRWGQLVLLVGMFIGRLGILLLLSALFGRRPPSRVRYPQEELIL